MKKTLVAVAALAAATGAMAEVTISGMFDAGISSVKSTTTAGVSSTTNTLASPGTGQSQIAFGASEDLGNGIKAFANLRIIPSPFGGAINSDASEIGLSGDFGTFQFERGYSIDHGILAAADASGYTGGSDGVVNNGNGGATGNAAVYVLPTFVQGLDVVLAKGIVGVAGGAGDSTAYKLTYNTGGLMLVYGASNAKTNSSTWATNFTIGGTTATTDTLANGGNIKSSSLAATYDLGMAKLYVGLFSHQASADGDQKHTSNMYGISVPFGATTVGLTVSAADRSSSTAVTKKATGYRASAKYAFSKRTTGYVAYGSESASSTTAKDAQTAVGLTHSF